MTDLITLIITFSAGLAMGGLFTWLCIPSRRSNSLQNKINETENKLKSQQDAVDEHFIRTAELMNKLIISYRDISEHVSEGTQSLCSDEGLRLAHSKLLEPLAQTYSQPTNPPLDYAPSHQGTLSEEFGLKGQAGPKPATTEEQDSSMPKDYAEGCDEQGCPPDDYKNG
jgi:uncharacterized membrane-anchored protein YhcB (DUF1043 family)